MHGVFGRACAVETSPAINGRLESSGGRQVKGRLSPHTYVVCLLLGDAFLIGALSAAVWWGLNRTRFAEFDFRDSYVAATLSVILSHFLWSYSLGVYDTSKVFDRSRGVMRVLLSMLASFSFVLLVSAAAKVTGSFSRLWLFLWIALSVASLLALRIGYSAIITSLLSKGFCVYKAYSIGIDCEPIRPSHILARTAHQVGVVRSIRLETFDQLEGLSTNIAESEADRIYIAAPWDYLPKLAQNLGLLRHLSAEIILLPARAWDEEMVSVSTFGKRPAFCAMQAPIQGWSSWFKRALDVGLTGALLVLLALPLAAVALAIRLESPGPILFRQIRTGFNGRAFQLLKFRSMYTELTDHHAEVQTTRDDPRVTRVGRFIRRTSIDELPQLINVLRGEMSLVGPRPHALATTAGGRKLDEIVDYYAARHRVKPGLTGLAQVHGLRGELDTFEKVRKRVDFDLEYIDNHTLWLDIEILMRTVQIVLGNSGAY